MPVDISIPRVICDFVVLTICAIPMLIFQKWVKPYKRGFYCDDESIHYPYRESTVTRYQLIAVGLALPVIIIVLTEIYRAIRWERKCSTQFKKYQCGSVNVHRFVVRLYVFLGYFLLGVCFNQLMVDIAKYTIGRHRPHFLDVCKPNVGYATCPTDHKYITEFNCTGTEKKLVHESMLSFYSGHASFSFYVAFYVSLYLRARLYRPIFSRLVVPVIQFSLFLGAAFVSYSRVSDYKHHWSDVLVGTIFGSATGIIVALWIAEVFKRREIPPAHDASCQFGLIPLDARNVTHVEEGVGVGIPVSSTSRPVIAARSIVVNSNSNVPIVDGHSANGENNARVASYIHNEDPKTQWHKQQAERPMYRSELYLDPVLVLPIN